MEKKGKLEHRRGDLFEALRREVLGPRAVPVNDPPTPFVVIPHVVNDEGLWGAGFVVELSKFDDSAEKAYMDWGSRELGQAEDVYEKAYEKAYEKGSRTSDARYCVFNMCAQHGVGGDKPLRYAALGCCMYQVAREVQNLKLTKRERAQIWCPKFGSGLAGGNWLLIEEMVRETWVEQMGLHVVVFTR